jgi:hypothetical protein
MARGRVQTHRRTKVNHPPQYTPGGPPLQPKGSGVPVKATQVPGRPNVPGRTGSEAGGLDKTKKPFDEAFARTKDLERKEGESDKDYAARQEQFKTRRGNLARRTLRSAYGKHFGKRVYEGKAQSTQYRQDTVSRFDKLRKREDRLSSRIENADDTALNDSFKAALQKKLDTVKSKRKEVGSSVREFRGQRREALQAAYENPVKAGKKYPRVPVVGGSLQAGNRGLSRSGVEKVGRGRMIRNGGSKQYNPYGFPAGSGKGGGRGRISRFPRQGRVIPLDRNAAAPGRQPTGGRPVYGRRKRKV